MHVYPSLSIAFHLSRLGPLDCSGLVRGMVTTGFSTGFATWPRAHNARSLESMAVHAFSWRPRDFPPPSVQNIKTKARKEIDVRVNGSLTNEDFSGRRIQFSPYAHNEE